MRKILKAVAGLFVLAGLFLVGSGTSGAPAGAQECTGYGCPPVECVFQFEYTAQVVSGGTLEITNGTSTNVSSIEVSIGGKVAGTVTPGDDGSFSGNLSVPSLDPGTYAIVATAQSDCGEYSEEDTIEVLAANTGNRNPTTNTVDGTNTTTTTYSDTPLARTGFDAAPMVTLGAAALVLGGAAVYGSKRRRTA